MAKEAAKHPNKELKLVTVYSTDKNSHSTTGEEMHVSEAMAAHLVSTGMASHDKPKEKKEK